MKGSGDVGFLRYRVFLSRRRVGSSFCVYSFVCSCVYDFMLYGFIFFFVSVIRAFFVFFSVSC